MNVIVEQRAHWLTQLARGASSMLGLGETVMAISTVARKRDLSAIWELDPVAAPPKRVQRQLMGAVKEDEPPPVRNYVRADHEQRSVLELLLQYAMRQHDVERVRTISRQLRAVEEAAQREATEHARSAQRLHTLGGGATWLGECFLKHALRRDSTRRRPALIGSASQVGRGPARGRT